MCFATAAAAGVAVAAVSTVASVGMGIMSAQQQASQAQAQMNMQAKQQARSREMQRQGMIQGQEQQRQSLMLQQRNQADQYNLSIQQSNVQIANQYDQQRRQVEMEREQIAAKAKSDRINYQRQLENADTQVRYNNQAANKAYVQEQTKMTEARKKAAFAQQTALAKSIGARGSILAAGRTGQSVGLLLNDAERQSGFEKAQADASLASSLEQSQLAMDGTFLQSQSANNQAISGIGMAPNDPYMPSLPGIPNFVDTYKDTEPFSET